jgi:hypothetical protein
MPPGDPYPDGRTPASLAFKTGLDAWQKERAKNKPSKPDDESDNTGGVAAQGGSDHEPRSSRQSEGARKECLVRFLMMSSMQGM